MLQRIQAAPRTPVRGVVVVVVVQTRLLVRVEVGRPAAAVAGPTTAVTGGAGPATVTDAAVAGPTAAVGAV